MLDKHLPKFKMYKNSKSLSVSVNRALIRSVRFFKNKFVDKLLE